MDANDDIADSTYTMLMDDLVVVGTPDFAYRLVKFCTEERGKELLEQMGLKIHPDKIHVLWLRLCVV